MGESYGRRKTWAVMRPIMVAEVDIKVDLPPQSNQGTQDSAAATGLASGFCGVFISSLLASGFFFPTTVT